MTQKQIISIILLAASIVYDLFPVDLIPDVPFIGWLDDVLITSSAALNCYLQFTDDGDRKLNNLSKKLALLCFLLIALIVVVLILIIVGLLNLFK